MKTSLILSLSALALLAACSSTQYVMSTKQGTMITVSGKPQLDEKTGTYSYTDTEGRKGVIRKDEVVQVIER
jgi:outer membrane biogenesis lipoprotein LolB